jgi:hypothetical protein
MTGIYYFRVSPLQHDLTAIFKSALDKCGANAKPQHMLAKNIVTLYVAL